MLELLWLAPALPFAGFLALVFFGRRLGRAGAAAVGVGSVGLAAGAALTVAAGFLSRPDASRVFTQSLWTWLDVGGLKVQFGLHLDGLSMLMTLVVTVVGFLIHLYSVEYLADDPSFAKFFAYLNLFVASMLLLVLGDNLLQLYLGWEGVGACSYLLIGFWYKDLANDAAARKAFIVTRVGDTAMALALFLIYQHLGTLEIQEALKRAHELWPVGAGLAVRISALLLGGAVGKSAQLPLQTWLPDAMAGPTPVSALIHAATMVTAGVYLIARLHPLFELAPDVQLAVGAVGAATLLLAGFSALTQTDIKRVLAYSTISQIGYMFLALGVGAYSAAMFHFFTHAFFKALLFLGAGAVILACHHEQNIFKMGGLRRELPLVFWTFLIGGAALAGFPLVTAGFYSKDFILDHAWHFARGGHWLWAAGMLGAFLTALYTFRLIFIVFFGEAHGQGVAHRPGRFIAIPLTVLAFFSVTAGLVQTPHWLGGIESLRGFLGAVFPARAEAVDVTRELILAAEASAVGIAGLLLAYWLYGRGRPLPSVLTSDAAASLAGFFRRGWDFDRLYDVLFVRPFAWVANVNRGDAIDAVYTAIASAADSGHRAVRTSQTGRLRWYAAALAGGAALVIAIVVLL